jgi:flagellar biosynthesis anti-sigma factor FlgM
MKLDLNGITAIPPVAPKTTELTASASDSTPATLASAPAAAVDRTSFSSGPTGVRALVGQALAAPEVRQGKVDSIRQSMANGTYKFDAAKVADAMISNKES